MLSDEVTRSGLAIVRCRLVRKGRVFGVNEMTLPRTRYTVVGYKLATWTSLECPNELMYQIRQGQLNTATQQSFDEGSPLTVGHLPFAGIYSHGHEVLFDGAILTELEQLSKTIYTTAIYKAGPRTESESFPTIPMLYNIRNLQRIQLSKPYQDLGRAPLGCQGVK